MAEKEWEFTEEQRNNICNGKMCPKCLSQNIKLIGIVPDGIHLNQQYKCEICNEEW